MRHKLYCIIVLNVERHVMSHGLRLNTPNLTQKLVVVVCLPRPMEGMRRLKFSDTVLAHASGVI